MRQGSNSFPHFGGFESTKIHGYNTDVLETTRHLELWRQDLELLQSAGIDNLRYSAPWHRIEPTPGHFDFSWIDQPMAYMRRHGMKPVIDLLHHTSFPDWLDEGFANPVFPDLFNRFVECFAQRYPWADSYTIFNEPLATTLLCSFTGDWYPNYSSDPSFVQMGHNVAFAIVLAEKTLRRLRPDFRHVYIDTCEHHVPLDRQSLKQAEFANQRRFWMLDLVLGRLTPEHPFFPYLLKNGLAPDSLNRFPDNPVKIDVLGLDYYPHSEMEWIWSRRRKESDISFPIANPVGFARIAAEYHARYKLPVMLTETNIRGYVTDRVTWLRFMEEQCEILVAGGADFRGFCWYPSIDSCDWSNLVTLPTCSVDPQGIWYLDDTRTKRCPSELSDFYTRLANGTASSRDLPAYNFQPPLDVDLAGYTKLMSHWEGWQEPAELEWGVA